MQGDDIFQRKQTIYGAKRKLMGKNRRRKPIHTDFQSTDMSYEAFCLLLHYNNNQDS